MPDAVTYNKIDHIGVMTVNNPPVNALNYAVRQGVADAVARALVDADVKALLLICEGSTFIPGADIGEFGKPPRGIQFADVLQSMEDASVPIVAAMHGDALGGGLETALACHYRVAVSSTRLGLPEVNLGLLPGGGGTQRLTRLVGPEDALNMIVGGQPIDAVEARRRGLIDAVIEGDLLEGALAFAQQLITDRAPLKRVRDLDHKIQNVDPALFLEKRTELAESKRNFIAPQRCVDAVEAACMLTFDEGLKRERQMFVELRDSQQSAALRHIFFAERAAAKIDGLNVDTPVTTIGRAGVIGAGTMGTGIVMNLINARIPTVMYELSQEALDRGIEQCRANYARTVEKGKLTEQQMEQRMALMTPSLQLKDVADADIVIEAVFEDMQIKCDVFAELDKVCRQGAILASNTSTLDINEIAAATSRPDAVIGLHFFSPANVMKLVEVVRGVKTSDTTLASSLALARTIGKIPVVVGVCDGFVGNRMIHKYIPEAAFLLEEGCLPQQVDNALYQWGMAMGPFTMGDLAGLDVGWRVRQRRGIPPMTGARYSYILDKICELGRYGQKTGGGFYDYDPQTRARTPNIDVESLVIRESALRGIERRTISDEEIVERTMFAMINEGAKILAEGVAQRASDIDVIYTSGYGFPTYRGGPMFYANQLGLDYVYRRVCDFNQQALSISPKDCRWTPSELLEELAASGGSFS